MENQQPQNPQSFNKRTGRIFKAPYRLAAISTSLPTKYNQSEYREQILALGKNAINCAKMISEIDARYPDKLNDMTLTELLESGESYTAVFEGYMLLCEHVPERATYESAQQLARLGDAASKYVAALISLAQKGENLYPVRSDLKVIIEDQKTSVTGTVPSRHSVKKSQKVPRKQSQYARGTSRLNKEWASKSAEVMSHSHQRYWQHKTGNRPYSCYAGLGEDAQVYERTAYRYLARQIFNNTIETKDDTNTINYFRNFDDLKTFIQDKINHHKEKRHYPDRPILQAYLEGLELIKEPIQILSSALSEAKPQSQAHDFLIREMTSVVQLPLKRAKILSQAAYAEKEILAQEIRRALFPRGIGIDNRYPKYRLSETQTSLEKSRRTEPLHIVRPEPELRISSELMDFRTKFSRNHLNEYLFHPEASRPHIQPISLSQIPGFGAAMLFAKFLGDTDPKEGNVGVAADMKNSAQPYVVVGIDSDLCYDRPLNEAAVLSDPREILHNPMTYRDYGNYFQLYRSSRRQTQYEKPLMDMSTQAHIQRENMATAFNLAFFPAEALELFSRQYLTAENSFSVAQNIHNHIVSHMKKEQKALYQSFDSEPEFLDYFLSSSEAQDNLFKRLELLVNQVEEFCFYQKHTMGHAMKGHQENMIANYFLTFIQNKLAVSPDEFRQQVDKSFNDWTPETPQGKDLKSWLRNHLQEYVDLELISPSQSTDILRYNDDSPTTISSSPSLYRGESVKTVALRPAERPTNT